jgi:hypothetical protein
MILLGFAALGLLIGLLTRGSLKALSHDPLKGLLLPIVAYALKAGAAFLLVPQRGAVVVASVQYGLLFLFLLLNLRRPVWPLFTFAGTLLNFLVIVSNGGCMPVSPSLLGEAGTRLTQLAQGNVYAYCLSNAATRLAVLGDIIRIGPVSRPLGFASIGDLVLGLGVGILFWHMTRKTQETSAHIEAQESA